MPRSKPYLVIVEWLDSAQFSGWGDKEDVLGDDVLPCTSIGWLVSRDKVALHMAGSRCRKSRNEWCERHSIPMGCVTSLKFIKVEGRDAKSKTK